MRLLFFTRSMLTALPPSERAQFEAIANRLHVPEHRPFFVGDDGLPDAELDGFSRYLICPRRPSPQTWKTYSYQISVFLRFVAAQGISSWRQVDRSVLGSYYIARTTGDYQNVPEIVGKSWNISKAALVLLYEYAHEYDLVEQLPYKYVLRKGWFGGDVKSIPELTAKVRDREINFIDILKYKSEWRPVVSAGRNGQRDSVLCDLLITTGLRIHEALNLKVHQIPDPDNAKFKGLKSVTINVTGKGDKKRKVRIPKRIVRQVRFYIEEDRAMRPHAEKNQHVFLSRDGARLSERRVQDFFEGVSQKVGINFTPHGCRHTFAIYQLDAMIKRLVSSMKDLKADGAAVYRQVILDPMRTLQKMLGHSDISMTYVYLDFLEETEGMVDETLNLWTQWESFDG